ncbi:CD209 antigen-like protein E [Engraulis encrasicolus]|uniref:CD209 antigen-like protein E n=1 Tax=Engraulis encrasicolus TaxID=184585 RepID=UPI002FD34F7F
MEEDIFIDKFNQTGWIGLQRTQNNWKWVDDTLLFRGYWRRPLPNNTVGDCVRTIPDFTNSASGWKASLCDSELFFYCEKSQL